MSTVTALTGTRALVRLALRRDRVLLPAWIAGIVLLVVSTASRLDEYYPTAGDRAALAEQVRANGSLRALTGPALDLSTTGGLTAWRILSFVSVLAGLMSLLVVVRHTRAEEEAGRSELLGAAVVGRYAGLASALAVAGLANLVAAALVTGGLLGLGLPAAGSVALGLAVASTGWVFAAVAALAAQTTSVARAASGTAAALLGFAYVLRAAGDVGSGALSWLSPIGWAEQVRAYADERWWVFALPLALVVGLVATAAALVPRRDLGAGLLPARLGRESAPERLRSPWALAWRLQRGTLLGWTVGYVVMGVAIGSVAADVGDLVADSGQASDLIRRLGGSADLVDSYLATVLGVLALVAGAYAVQAVLRVRAEETSLRAEPVLATATSRSSWAGAHVAVAALGSAWLVLASAASLGVVHGLRVDDVGGQLGSLLVAGLAQLPAVWVLGGLAVALTGALPRLVAAAWVALGLCLALAQVGVLLELPSWLLDLSPFQHSPRLPAAELTTLPLVLLLAAAAALTVAGFAGLRRRDVL